LFKRSRATLALVTVLSFVCGQFCAPLQVEAQTQAQRTTTILASIVDSGTGLPVSNASVALFRGDLRITTASTNGSGTATFANQPPGDYHFDIRAQGYTAGRSDDVVVAPGTTSTTVRATLLRSSLSTGDSLQEIGRVVTSQRTQLQTTSTITQSISTERLQRENYVRVGDSLNVLPGVNLNGQDSAVGDDLSLNIRGIGSSESAVLLDGHQIGPFGAGGQGFNLQLTPIWALRNVDVTYGSGAQNIYGIDAIAGAVDMQTLNPSRKPQAYFLQGAGNQGKDTSVAYATGTINRLGYVFEGSTQGTFGSFKPAPRLQSGFFAGSQDFSDAGIAAAGALYGVSSNYLLRDGLGKLTYQINPKTNISAQYYVSSSQDDKTGNGDNDSNGAAYSYNLVAGPGGLYGSAAQGSLIAAADSSTPCGPVSGSNSASIPVLTNAGNQCLTPSQYALATSGPNGGGAARAQWDALRDATFRYNQDFYNNNHFAAQVFTDSYEIDTTRYPKTQSARYKTFGIQLSDTRTSDNNTFTVGYYSPHQQERSDQTIKGVLTQGPVLGQSTANFFASDEARVNSKLSILANVWTKQSSVTGNTSLDPRLSLVVRPTNRDVFRLTGARSNNVPDIGLTQGVSNFTQAGAVNVTCGGLTTIGTIPSANLRDEKAKDVEFAYGHSFTGDSQIQVALYSTNIADKLIGTATPLAAVPQFLQDAGFTSQLNDYLAKFNKCGTNFTSAAQLSQVAAVSGTLNAANGQYRGVEISGRARVNRHIYFDYSYNIQSAQLIGLNTATLLQAPTLQNNSQLVGVPQHKGTLGFDFSDGHGLEVRLDGFYVGTNNGYDRPAYTFFNGGVSKALRTGTSLTLGVQNIFNSASQSYGVFGEGVYVPYNPVYAASKAAAGSPVGTTAVALGNESFGLAPRSIFFSLSQRVGGK